ncbi:serine/threonine protein kinase [Virgisporangium aliadipatigenens]|uniref:Serine/threonine protein kinase n=1 Tax=Virgisporangium aliadipatigenens TaxID=741659 RepID=A0A8J3YMC5_9ACTN|nr:class III lanthionine synthetase LanKC [Virgisporangium aliadipatigenens]GIJ47866.1 serine/threonine protein kinase [Virgisporangium aliadipatigenens]
MEQMFDYVAADREFYAPLEESGDDGGEVFRPGRVPEGWTGTASGVWTHWRREPSTVEHGWKVHVSAAPARVQAVLDLAAPVLFDAGVPFKHLANRHFYWWTHHKFAQRAQGGKFIAAYPADVETAAALMERLRVALDGEDGPYILSDRRFGDSRTVHYRYGAFRRRVAVRADGTRTLLVGDVEDVRGVRFRLPAGVTDPFRTPRPGAPAAARPAAMAGFSIDSSVRFTNAGGIYRGTELATGKRVFIKEARPHIGLREDGATATEQLRQEWRALTDLHARAPGIAPEPLAFFRAWDHEFVVMEHVEGQPLTRWTATHHPLLRTGSTPADFAAFYRRAANVIDAVERALERLHRAGYLFVDVSPVNVLVADDDSVRLVDFGAAHRLGDPFVRSGTPGYAPPRELVGDDLGVYDRFGLSRLAQHLLGPLHFVLGRSPAALYHLRHELAELAPVPAGLWRRSTEYRAEVEARLPDPAEVAADPERFLGELRDGVADALLAMAAPEHPSRIFPTIAQGYQTNTVCVAYGTAGVLHALHRAGRPLPDGVRERFRRDALDQADRMAPGLYVGTAGVAHVLATHGCLDEANDLLERASRHPLLDGCATLYGGVAGVALAHLALHRHTGDERHLDRAAALADGLPADAELGALLDPDDTTGLMHGRSGVAHLLAQLGGATGERRYTARAVRLLHHELDRATDPDAPGLLFPYSAVDRRAMPYLFVGTAGMLLAATRVLRLTGDERLTAAMPRLLAPLRLRYTWMPGLFQGLAGYGFALADHAMLTGSPRADAVRVATGLFKYAVPHPTGIRYLGDRLMRFSADLWSGSAGVLLALEHVLNPSADALFTVDAPARVLAVTA